MLQEFAFIGPSALRLVNGITPSQYSTSTTSLFIFILLLGELNP